MKRVNASGPTMRRGQGTTAFPPLGHPAATMDEWMARRHNRPSIWRRLFRSTARG